ELSPFNRMKLIAGLRAEKFVQHYTGQDQLGYNVLDNATVIDDLDFFPSVNLIYSITPQQNFRLSYAKTIARPSFKELSYAEIFDPITGRVFIGGLFRDANDVSGIEYWDGDLQSTDIHNIDLRWEWFGTTGQTYSVSGFYKYFSNPIEIVQFATQTGAFQPRNVGDGQVIGAEFEMRQRFGFISEGLDKFSIIANVTWASSQCRPRLRWSGKWFPAGIRGRIVLQCPGENPGDRGYCRSAGHLYTCVSQPEPQHQ
ncbi:MAG: TonB-dependent receptor, partial [Bacteroidales bacterium]|nr:TonB-dependent receptor [Bacteroidales bacterium]